MLSLRAPAKLNLGLRILGRRDDGYHEIETVFLPLRLYDELELCWSETPGIQLDLSGHAASGLPTGPENLVTRAALATCAALGVTEGLRIRLEKRIPIAAGLGGGSSDAAATIRGVEQLAGKRDHGHGRRRLGLNWLAVSAFPVLHREPTDNPSMDTLALPSPLAGLFLCPSVDAPMGQA